jgi:hypothetical protein
MDTKSHRAPQEGNTYMQRKVLLKREPEYHQMVLAALANLFIQS